MARGRRQLFIYYRLPAPQAEAALAAVAAAQRALVQASTFLSARHLVRVSDSPPEQVTVMEVYETDAALRPDGVDGALQAEIEHRLQDALAPWLLPAARHLEVFDDPTCA